MRVLYSKPEPGLVYLVMSKKRFGPVSAERNEQFQKVLRSAQGDANEPDTQRARAFLRSVIAGETANFSTQNSSFRFWDLYYSDKPHNWAAEAAEALANAATIGQNGRDLTAAIVHSLLTLPSIDAHARDILQNAWKEMKQPYQGASMIPQSSDELASSQ